MQGLRVEGSAFTGLNVTTPEDYFVIQDSKFVNNRGKITPSKQLWQKKYPSF